jgi:hypothetical protein
VKTENTTVDDKKQEKKRSHKFSKEAASENKENVVSPSGTASKNHSRSMNY